MIVIYSPRSVRDLDAIAAYYRTVAGSKVAAEIGERFEHVVRLLAEQPESYPRVPARARFKGRVGVALSVQDFSTACGHARLKSCMSAIRRDGPGNTDS